MRLLELGLLLATAGAGLTALWLLYLGARRSPVVGLGLVFLPVLLRILARGSLLPDGEILLDAGPVSISPLDVASVVFFVVVVERVLARSWTLPAVARAAVLYLLIGLMSAGLGVLEHDVFAASNQFRKHFYFVSAVLYFASQPRTSECSGTLLRWWVSISVFLALLGALRWALPLDWLLGSLGSGPGGVGRPWPASTTLILLIGAIFALHSRHPRWVPLSLLVAVVAFQHRTVWAAAAFALLVLLAGPHRRRLLPLAAVALAVLVSLIFLVPQTIEGASSPLQQAAESTGTFDWRVEGWRTTIPDQLQRPEHWLFGRTFGTPWTRDVFGRQVEVSPHNMYVEVLLRLGLLGVLAYLALYARLLGQVRATEDRELKFTALSIAAVIVAYGLTYDVDMVQGAALGIVAAMSIRDQRYGRTRLTSRVMA